MPDYHPLDTRHKANKAAKAPKAEKPWRNVAEPAVPSGAKAGPIRDDDTTEWRARERIGRAAERAALKETPLIAHLFGPATLFYKIRATLIGERARGHSHTRIALQFATAFGLYFLVYYMDGLFDLTGLAGAETTMKSIN